MGEGRHRIRLPEHGDSIRHRGRHGRWVPAHRQRRGLGNDRHRADDHHRAEHYHHGQALDDHDDGASSDDDHHQTSGTTTTTAVPATTTTATTTTLVSSNTTTTTLVGGSIAPPPGQGGEPVPAERRSLTAQEVADYSSKATMSLDNAMRMLMVPDTERADTVDGAVDGPSQGVDRSPTQGLMATFSTSTETLQAHGFSTVLLGVLIAWLPVRGLGRSRWGRRDPTNS